MQDFCDTHSNFHMEKAELSQHGTFLNFGSFGMELPNFKYIKHKL